MLNASSSKVRKESLKESSLESKVSSRQSTEEMGSEDSDRCEPNSTEGKHWHELLKEKIGFDVNAKKWMEEHPELAYKNKSELLIRLACEVCLAKNTKYNPENENEEQNNKYIRFDAQRVFEIFKVANPLINLSDRKNFVEFVCQKGNVQLLEMICQRESKDGGDNSIVRQYRWKGTFTGYSKLIDLLQYVIDSQCSQEIVLCVAEKIYGYAHILCNGKQHLDNIQVTNTERIFDYQDSVIKKFLKQAIKLGYKDIVSVMLAGDIYHSIRLMKWERFQERKEFVEAYNMIKETVADVISSWVENEESCKDGLRRSLDQGIEIDLHKMSKKDLLFQLEQLEKKVISKSNITKEKLVQKLKSLGEKKLEVKLRPIVVGILISTLFFRYQDKAIKGESFTQKIIPEDKLRKEKKVNQLNQKVNSGENIDDTVLELIESLNSANHFFNNWFFREVLAKVVNENLDKLKAVCAAICKEPMEELLNGEEIHEDVRGVLQFFGVEVLTNQIVRSEIPSSCSSIADQFMKDINVYSEKEAKGDCSSDELAFSGLTRKIIRDLEEKKGLADEEKKALIPKALSEIKKGINILADKTAVKIDVKDIFLSLEAINDKITKDERREIVELTCQKSNVRLLEMICQRENKDKGGSSNVGVKYKWNGTFTGYSNLIDLLQYVIDSQCSQEIVLCVAEKIYGYAHILCNGKQYLDRAQAGNIKVNFGCQDSIVKELLKQAVKLGYKDAVLIMLSGDIYHCIRLMKWQKFQEEPEFIAAYDMIKETVLDVVSSWVKEEESKQYCKNYLQCLLDQGIKVNMKDMDAASLAYQLEYLGKGLVKGKANVKQKLVQKLKELGKEKGEVILRPTIVGSLISMLFFRYQDKAIKGESFTQKIIPEDKLRKEKKVNQLNQKVNSGENIDDTVLELIESLNSANHFL